ncbi:MAG: hypothetical protein BWY71_00034 [Planctomycetes bacterium ADurb.Bin412]|nr:MAG: hypothetical protein BWY71_00034 [Planctomycetes bacterium ADurb.Bin412]
MIGILSEVLTSIIAEGGFVAPVREALIGVLKPVATWFYELTAGVPLWAVLLLFVVTLLMLAGWVISLKSEKPDPAQGSGGGRIFSDLRLWAVLILLIQTVIYLVLG